MADLKTELRKVLENASRKNDGDYYMQGHLMENQFDSVVNNIAKVIEQRQEVVPHDTDVSICTCGTEKYTEKEARENGIYYCGKCNKRY